MKNSVFKFYIIKLLLIFLVSVCSAIAAYLVGNIVSPFDSIFYRIITSGIPMIFFMYFMYTVESRIKIPEGCTMSAGYLFRFSLSEASVYTIFLIPLTVICLVKPDFIKGTGLIQFFYASHSLLTHLTGSALINLVGMSVIFGIIAATAHYIKSTRPVLLNDTEATSESAESVDADDVNDAE